MQDKRLADLDKWLADLKAGDEVAIYQHIIGYRVSKVQKRTPTGRITLEDGSQFDSSGYNRSNRQTVEPVTQEILNAMEHNKLVLQLNLVLTKLNINTLRQMENQQLEEILNVMQKHVRKA